MSHKPSGGLHSRVVKHSTNPKVEPRAYARNPAAVAQYGQLQGSHITRGEDSKYRGEPDPTRQRGYNNPVGPTNMALSGPGAGREIMRAGGQGTHGSPSAGNAPSRIRDTLAEFGPDYRRPSNPGRDDRDADF
jgi:hypothetical protein